MCKVYGYCRISRKEQNIERQERNILAAYPDAIIIKEAFTGTKIEGRKELEKLLRVIKAGDTIVFDSVSRMSRNAEEGFALYKELFEKQINLVFLKEGYVNTRVFRDRLQQSNVTTGKSYLDEGLRTILLGLAEEQVKIAFDQAEKEVMDLRQRTKEGLKTVMLRNELIRSGVIQGEETPVGRSSGTVITTKKSKAAKKIIFKHSRDFLGTLQDADVIKLAGISRNSFYKYKRELVQELQAEA